MLIYKDKLNGDELISDSFDLKDVDGVAFEVKCRNITVGGDTFDIGGNPSAEGGDDEGTDDAKQQVLDVVQAMRLSHFGDMDKKGYLGHLKEFFRALKEKMRAEGKSEEDVKAFETKAQPFAKKLVGNLKDTTFYIGENGIKEETVIDKDGNEASKPIPQMFVPFYFEEGAAEPTAIFWKDGLKEEKV